MLTAPPAVAFRHPGAVLELAGAWRAFSNWK